MTTTLSPELRRPDLYQPACFLCATALHPQAVLSLPAVRRWHTQYSAFKAERSATHVSARELSVSDPGRLSWQAVRRWSDGAAADFHSVDRLMTRLHFPMRPDTFPRSAYLRRINSAWDWRDAGIRLESVYVLAQAEALVEGRQPARDEDGSPVTPSIVTPSILDKDIIQCPACGGPVGSPKPEGKTETRTERRARERRSAARIGRLVATGQLTLPVAMGGAR